MATYADYLRENGATEEDIKILDTPVARRAHEKMEAAAADAKRRSDAIIEQNRIWAEQVETQNQSYLRERDSAKIEAAAAAARIAKMGELGLIEVAERMEPGSTRTAATEPGVFDPKLLENYVNRDTLMQVAEREGEGISTQADILYEHIALFGNDPSKKPNFRELRNEAKTRKVPMEQVWKERYGVDAVRAQKAAEEKSAYEAKISADAITKYKSEHPESNPLMAQPVISRIPFAGKVMSGGDRKQPWQMSDAEKENARVQKGIDGLAKAGLLN